MNLPSQDYYLSDLVLSDVLHSLSQNIYQAALISKGLLKACFVYVKLEVWVYFTTHNIANHLNLLSACWKEPIDISEIIDPDW